MGKVLLIILLVSLATENNIDKILEWLFWAFNSSKEGNSKTTTDITGEYCPEDTAPISSINSSVNELEEVLPIERFTTEKSIKKNEDEDKTLAWEVSYPNQKSKK